MPLKTTPTNNRSYDCHMKTLLVDHMDELWDVYWNSLSSEWFKLEALQDYTAGEDSPSLIAWLKGDKKASLNLLKNNDDPGFTAECRQKRSQGVKLWRVHVMHQLLSPYRQWEIEYYKKISQPLRSENVRIIGNHEISDFDLPAGDLMIFDDQRAILNTYNQNGLLVSAKFYNQNDTELNQFLSLKKAILERSKPL